MSLTMRDRAILENLNRFGLMNRKQIEKIHFADCSHPHVNANRVLKRLARDGHVIPIPQPKEKPYVYKSAYRHVRENTSRFEHYLEIVDTFIELGQPKFFQIEPNWEHYKPDIYTEVNKQKMCVEVQRSKVSNQRIQDKINSFVTAYRFQEHQALILWIRTPYQWIGLKAPSKIKVIISPRWN